MRRRERAERRRAPKATFAASTSRTGKRLWIFHTIPHEGRIRVRHVGERIGAKERQPGRLGADERRSGARPCLCARRNAGGRLLWRQPAGQQCCSARVLSRSISRPANGSGTTRPFTTAVGLGPAVRADAVRHERRTAAAIKALAQPTKSAFLFVLNRETGEPIWPIEERPVPQSNVPGREDQPDAAVSHQAGAIRPAGRLDRRPDRLHAGASRRGPGKRQAIQDRAALHAASPRDSRWPDCDAHASRRCRWRELARRLI